MAANQLAPTPVFKAFDNNGTPLYNGKLFTYQAGTSTPQTTYTDSTLSNPNTNPIILNSRGEANVWLNPSQFYKFVLQDSTGAQIWSVDNIAGSSNTFSMPTATGTANALVITNPIPISLSVGQTQWFVPSLVNTAAATLNVDSTGSQAINYLGLTLTGNELQIGIPYLAVWTGVAWAISWTGKGPGSDYYVDSGVTNSITITAANALTGNNLNGTRFKVKVGNTNTSTPQMQANLPSASRSFFNIYYSDGTTQLVAGSLIQNNIYTFTFDTSLNSSAGGWICSDPSSGTGSATLTLATGWATTPTGTANYRVLPDGKTAYIYIASALTATSNAATFGVTGLPAILQPVTTKRIAVALEDATAMAAFASSMIMNAASGTINGSLNAAGTGGFTATGTKGFVAGTEWSYTLD